MKRFSFICASALTLYAAAASAQDLDVSDSDASAIQQASEALPAESEALPAQSEALPGDDAVLQAPADAQPAEVPVLQPAPNDYVVTVVESPAPQEQVILHSVDSKDPAKDVIWGKGFGLFFGIGPAIDLRDPAVGYSSRIGIDVHAEYWGLGLEVTWNSIWMAESARRIDNQDAAYKVTNSGLLLSLDGYAPINNHFIFKGGGAIGVGRRYETIFSDYPNLRESGSSWLARLRAGAFYIFDSHFTVGLDIEFNLGNYTDDEYKWWSDGKMDVSLGIILHASYQFLNW